jgi:hypothetical protein
MGAPFINYQGQTINPTPEGRKPAYLALRGFFFLVPKMLFQPDLYSGVRTLEKWLMEVAEADSSLGAVSFLVELSEPDLVSDLVSDLVLVSDAALSAM